MLHVKTIRDTRGTITLAAVIEASADVNVESRWDWKTFGDAEDVAAALGPDYIATDSGAHVSPRYDVIRIPQVGDEVSGEFNGDSYPEGKIVSVSKSLRLITTDTGKKFYRVRRTGAWRANQTWSLTRGHVSKLNPSF
jgi:hypothetical protein